MKTYSKYLLKYLKNLLDVKFDELWFAEEIRGHTLASYLSNISIMCAFFLFLLLPIVYWIYWLTAGFSNYSAFTIAVTNAHPMWAVDAVADEIISKIKEQKQSNTAATAIPRYKRMAKKEDWDRKGMREWERERER